MQTLGNSFARNVTFFGAKKSSLQKKLTNTKNLGEGTEKVGGNEKKKQKKHIIRIV